jgi:hypothetical protein
MMMGKVNDIAAAGVTHVWLPPPLHSVANESHPPLFTLKNIEDTADTGSDLCLSYFQSISSDISGFTCNEVTPRNMKVLIKSLSRLF